MTADLTPETDECGDSVDAITLRLRAARDAGFREGWTALLREVYALHEETVEKYHGIAQSDLEGKEGAFARGRCAEAKSIARALGALTPAPAEPSAPVAPAVEDIVHRYAQEYEWRADEGDHTPTDDERALLEDFGNGLLSEVEGRDRDRITALEAENAALREVVAAVAKHVEGMDLGGSEHDHVCYRVDLRTDLLRRARALLQGQGGGDA